MPVQIISHASGVSGYLTPAPFVTIDKNYINTEGGLRLRTEYTISLTGTIVNVGDNQYDSPGAQSSGISINDIIDEQERIKGLFGKSQFVQLNIISPDTSGTILSAECKVESENFERSTWTMRCDYSVVLKTNRLNDDPIEENPFALQSAAETWNFAENPDGTANVSHDVSAIGALIYASGIVNNPTNEAKLWCQSKKRTSTSGTLDVSASGSLITIGASGLSDTVNYWNRACVEGFGFENNSWKLSESFVYNPLGNAREDISASVEYDQNDRRRITINQNGAVFGFSDTLSDFYTRYTNAKTYYFASVDPNFYIRALTYIPSGYSINPVALVKQVTHEVNGGAIKYSATFGAASGMLLTNAIDENISVVDNASTDVFAQIAVPGRAAGPVVQYMNTKTLPERSVSITASYAQISGSITIQSLRSLYLAKPNTDDIILALIPNSGYYYMKQNSEEWNPIRRTYSRNVSWMLQSENNSVSGIPSGINYPNPSGY